MRRLIERFALICFGFVIALALGEAAVRLLDVGPKVIAVNEGRYQLAPNALRGYEPIPGLNYTGEELYNYDWRGETTALGYRGPDYPFQKAPGVVRIVVLGDSLASGLWVEDYRDTFPGVIEANLRRDGHSVELLNFGIVGYNTRQEVEVFKDVAIRYQPDIVVVEYCGNDHERNDGALLQRLLDKESNGVGLSVSLLSNLYNHSTLYRLLRYQVLPKFVSFQAGPTKADRFQILADDTVEPSVQELARAADQTGVPVLFALFPHFGASEEIDHKMNRISEVAREVGFQIVDLREGFKKCAESGESLNFDEYHPTAAGHHCAGNILASALHSRLSQNGVAK